MDWNLTFHSVARLPPLLLSFLIAVFLLRSKKGGAGRVLAGYFFLLTIFQFGYVWGYTVFHPVARFAWVMASFIVFALVMKLVFCYRTGGRPFGREERWVVGGASFIAAAAFLDFVLRADSYRFFYSNHLYGYHYTSRYIPVVTALLFFWGAVVLFRQAVRAAKGRSFFDRVRKAFHPRNKDALSRIPRAFFYLTVLEFLMGALAAFQVSFPILDQRTAVVTTQIGMMVLFFLYPVVYFHVSTEPTRLSYRFTGIALVTVLFVISWQGLAVVETAETQWDEARLHEAAFWSGLITKLDVSPAKEESGRGPQYILTMLPNNKFEMRNARAQSPAPFVPGPEDFSGPIRTYRTIGEERFIAYRTGDKEVGFSYALYRHFIHRQALPFFAAVTAGSAFILVVFPIVFGSLLASPLRGLLNRLRLAVPHTETGTEDEIADLSQSLQQIFLILNDAREKYQDYMPHLDAMQGLVLSGDAGDIQTRRTADRALVYRSAQMKEVLAKVDRVAAYTRPVLITGETGTGKELIARILHEAGRTQEHPFVAVNCAAISESLWEDEVFGHVSGAYTDARHARRGRVAEAGQGTLFFDEIGEMPVEMQAKMLRLLQEAQYTPVGADKPERALCRFVFATNRDLEAAILQGRFRSDLYYRIHVFRIDIPPLRQRPADIEPIADAVLEQLGEESGRPFHMDEVTRQALVRASWPGNVRELESVLVRAAANSDNGTVLVDLPSGSAGTQNGSRVPADGGSSPLNFDERVAHYARTLIQEALARADGNKTKAAEQLGINRSRLRYQIKELGIRE